MPPWLSSLLVVSSWLVLSIFTLSMSRSSLSKDLILIIFPNEVTSRSPIKNLPPLICRYCSIRLPRGLFWNLDVKTKSYPSASKSSTWRVLTIAELVCAVNVNFSHLVILSFCHAWTHSAMACRNDDFWSPLTTAFPRQLLVFNAVFEFDMTHYLLNNLRNSTVLFSLWKYDWVAAAVFSWNIASPVRTFCLKFPGCKTFVVKPKNKHNIKA